MRIENSDYSNLEFMNQGIGRIEVDFFQRFGSTKVNSLKVGELLLILGKVGELLSILLILEKLKSIL